MNIFHACNVLNVTLNDATQVLPVPLLGPVGGAPEGFGIAARHQPFSEPRFGPTGSAPDVGLEGAFQQNAQEPAGFAFLLRFRERL